MTSVAIVYHSGYGHTKLQAEAVAAGVESVAGVTARLLTADEALADMDSIAAADAIVFGAPTYMGSASAKMTEFMDATSRPWFSGAWKDKIAGGFTNSGSPAGDKLITLTQFAVLAAQHGMIWVSLGLRSQSADPSYAGPADEAINRAGHYLGAAAQSANAAPSPNNPPKGDIETARLYGARIATVTKRWMGK